MKLLEKLGSETVRKAVLAAALVAGFTVSVGARSASAAPRIYVGIGGPVVIHRGYYAQPRPYWRPVYVRPGHGYYYGGPRVRYWDQRFGCWRYR
jgi:hypothetical protein